MGWQASRSLRTDLALHALEQAIWDRTRDGADLDDAELATLEWVDWFNHRRLFHELGRIPPAEFEDQHYRYINSDRQVETQTNTPA